MKAVVFSIGEPTTELCAWSLKRNGFSVSVWVDSKTSLWRKLKDSYYGFEEDFLRVDADIIVNRNLTPGLLKNLPKEVWWWQFRCFDWFRQDIGHNLSFMRKESLPALRKNVGRFEHNLRPETEMSRIKEFYEPRRFDTYEDRVMGIHGYGITDLEAVIKLKEHREQMHLYDFELVQKLNEL